MDQALVTFHNELSEEVQVVYTSDFCYKVKTMQCPACLHLLSLLCVFRFLCTTKSLYFYGFIRFVGG